MSSKSSSELVEGNSISSTSRQISPAKKWCFTFNNYDESSISSIFSCLDEGDNCIIGEEVGESGTPHLQGFCEFHKKIRPLSVIKIPGIHWIKCKGTKAQNIKYCAKDGKFSIYGKIKIIKPVKILKDNLLFEWQKIIVEIVKQEPSDRTIFWFTDGGKCNTGKTTFCKYLCMKYDAIMLGGKAADMKNGIIDYIKNFETTPELILVNLPKTEEIGYLSYSGIETCKDMCFYSGKYEGGQVCGNCPHLIIFSNSYPDWDKVDAERWKCYHVVLEKWISKEDMDSCDIDDIS